MEALSIFSLDTLDDVKRDFSKWRASRPHKTSKIPKRLWNKVLAMLEYHSIAELTKELGVSSSQISAKVAQLEAGAAKTKISTDDNFVELNFSTSTPNNTSANNTCTKVEIRRADGAILTIAHLPQQTILQVLNQFTKMVQ